MQKPVIQRIKRRVEVCQSLPVTCGHRGNDTGNGLVTVVSLQCAVDCFPENGKSPHSKPFTFLLLPTAKCRSGLVFHMWPGTPSPPPSRCHRGWQSRRSASCSGTKTYAPHRSMRHSPMQSWQTIWSYCPNGSKSNLRHESASLYFGLHQE